MIPKSLMKNPALMIGILFMFIFLSQLREDGMFGKRAEKLTPTSCRAVRVMLDKRIPASWINKCNKNNLIVTISSSIDIVKLPNRPNALKAALYRELANNLIYIAKNSPEDNLERTDTITVHMVQDKLKINAVTFGKDIIKFKTLKSEKFILDHLKLTVKVQEVQK